MMPYMDGYTFLDEVRKNPDWVQIPFYSSAPKVNGRDIHRGLRSGVEEYITKPYNSDELLGLVVKQLNHYFRLRRSMSQDFDALKRSILGLITPDFRVPSPPSPTTPGSGRKHSTSANRQRIKKNPCKASSKAAFA
ncbi:MAG: response regulator [Chloroflexi bacterium]|nr:response regulator [Chloroflexota bacterium]